VKKGTWLGTTDVAIKVFKRLTEEFGMDSTEMNAFYQEVQLLSQLRHPNIVSMFGVCKKDGFICLITEFVKGKVLG
jgi:serine/threonine protein kinase